MPALTIDLEKLSKELPPGTWAAVSHDRTRIVCYGRELHEVLEEIRRLGEPDPLLLGPPPFNMSMAF